jgi:hypothetical protein
MDDSHDRATAANFSAFGDARRWMNNGNPAVRINLDDSLTICRISGRRHVPRVLMQYPAMFSGAIAPSTGRPSIRVPCLAALSSRNPRMPSSKVLFLGDESSGLHDLIQCAFSVCRAAVTTDPDQPEQCQDGASQSKDPNHPENLAIGCPYAFFCLDHGKNYI